MSRSRFTRRPALLLPLIFGLGMTANSCAGDQIKYSDPVEALYDNFWVDENTLQIQVEYNSPETAPYTMRRESSCARAREMVDARLHSLYPSMKDLAYQARVYKTVYHKKVDCRLVVHVRMPGLKKKLDKQE